MARATAALRSILATAVLVAARACLLGGYDSGECRSVAELSEQINFCRDVVTYRACVPRSNSLFPNVSASSKDRWVEETYKSVIAERIRYESDESLEDKGVNEHEVEGAPEERFTDNEDCQQAYRNFLCWANFPLCNAEQKSLILCRSVCENYFVSCGYSEDMWRCGPSIYHNGYEPEGDEFLDDDGYALHMRDFFPGQPFRDNSFDEDGEPIAICTPSIKNAAPTASPHLLVALAAGLVSTVAQGRGL